MTSIGERIRAWRQELRLTPADFAAEAKLSANTLKGYELGQRLPGADALIALGATGVDINWLLSGEGRMRYESPHRPAADHDKWMQRRGSMSWETKDRTAQNLHSMVMNWITEPEDLPWLPRSISLSDFRLLVEGAASLLDEASRGNPSRLTLLMMDFDVVEAALRLAFEGMKSSTTADASTDQAEGSKRLSEKARTTPATREESVRPARRTGTVKAVARGPKQPLVLSEHDGPPGPTAKKAKAILKPT